MFILFIIKMEQVIMGHLFYVFYFFNLFNHVIFIYFYIFDIIINLREFTQLNYKLI
jgi:hypothetical protein